MMLRQHVIVLAAKLDELITDADNDRQAQELTECAQERIGKRKKKPMMMPSKSIKIIKLEPQRGWKRFLLPAHFPR